MIYKIKDNQYNIEYQPLGDKFKIILFADATFANHEDGGNQGGHLIFLVDENSRFNWISWQSKWIKWVVPSSLAPETLALSNGVDHAIYLSVLLKESYPIDIPTEIFTDNKSLHDAIHSEKFVHFDKVINILWIKSANQLADCLTKTTADCQKFIQVLSNEILLSNDM